MVTPASTIQRYEKSSPVVKTKIDVLKTYCLGCPLWESADEADLMFPWSSGQAMVANKNASLLKK
jgi:hypothetical protein